VRRPRRQRAGRLPQGGGAGVAQCGLRHRQGKVRLARERCQSDMHPGSQGALRPVLSAALGRRHRQWRRSTPGIAQIVALPSGDDAGPFGSLPHRPCRRLA
jgi:hypothetical protein